MKRIFILSYEGIEVLNDWFDPSHYSESYSFHIIDNGNQTIPERLKPYLLHACEENIFCAGGWNLACKIGFDSFNEDKIIVTEDDVIFNQNVIDKCFEMSNENTFVGANNDQFFYSFYCMHKEIFKKVGGFDENCLFATCEDGDHRYKCGLEGVALKSPNIYLVDLHISSRGVANKYGNLEYVTEKWNKYTSKQPLNDFTFRKEYWSYFKKEHNRFMSEVEFDRFAFQENKK